MLNNFSLVSFHGFIKEHQVIQGAIILIIGNLFSSMMKQFNKEVIKPLVRFDLEKLKKIDYSIYLIDLFEVTIAAYILFVMFKGVHLLNW